MAQIEKMEVAFPLGEILNSETINAKCEIRPVFENDGTPGKKGKIVIEFEYDGAIIEDDDSKLKSKAFAVLDTTGGRVNYFEVDKIDSIIPSFMYNDVDGKMKVNITISGTGTKKNSFS